LAVQAVQLAAGQQGAVLSFPLEVRLGLMMPVALAEPEAAQKDLTAWATLAVGRVARSEAV
jgi:hypothetical protein